MWTPVFPQDRKNLGLDARFHTQTRSRPSTNSPKQYARGHMDLSRWACEAEDHRHRRSRGGGGRGGALSRTARRRSSEGGRRGQQQQQHWLAAAAGFEEKVKVLGGHLFSSRRRVLPPLSAGEGKNFSGGPVESHAATPLSVRDTTTSRERLVHHAWDSALRACARGPRCLCCTTRT